MRIEQLQYFLEISKCQSLSQAAENLYIGKSTMSSAISALEKELQNELFTRTPRGTYLTSFGESILPLAEQILDANEKISELSQFTPAKNSQMLYIYAYPIGAISAVVRLLQYMRDYFPDTCVSVAQTHSENVIQDLTAAGHSVGIAGAGPLTHHYMKENAENHNFVFEPVFEDPMYAFVHKNHPFSQCASIRMAQLEQEPVVVYRRFISPDTNVFYHDFKNLKRFYSVESYELMKMALENDSLIAISPELAFYEDQRQRLDDIVQIPIDDCSVVLTISLVYKKDPRTMTPLEIAATSFLRNYYAAIRTKKERGV